MLTTTAAFFIIFFVGALIGAWAANRDGFVTGLLAFVAVMAIGGVAIGVI